MRLALMLLIAAPLASGACVVLAVLAIFSPHQVFKFFDLLLSFFGDAADADEFDRAGW